jgi:hypothetical protein
MSGASPRRSLRQPQRCRGLPAPAQPLLATPLATLGSEEPHNLQRWVAILGLGERRITQHRTIRNRYLAIPGRLVTHARRWRLRLPVGWPWRERFLVAIEHLRALPAPA